MQIDGQKFARLTVIGRVPSTRRDVMFLCACECGSNTTTDQSGLLRGRVKSCGCLRAELNAARHIKHGKRYSRAYKSWACMKQRCQNPRNPDFSHYGGRGISICERWQKFENFVDDMGEPAPGLTIDRIDPNGNYEPSNCRWATRATQRVNQRSAA